MAEINITLDIFAMIVTVVLFLCLMTERNRFDKSKGLFAMLLILNYFALLCDIMTWRFDNQKEYTVLLYICNFLVFILGYIMTLLYAHYLASFVSKKKVISNKVLWTIDIICGIEIFLVIVSLFNGMYFSYHDGVYVRGSLYMLSQIYPIIVIITTIIILLWHKPDNGWRDTVAMMSYSIFPIIAIIVKMLTLGISLLYAAITLSLLIIYIVIEMEERRQILIRERELEQANIRIMFSEIQPHFLYNTLSTIAYLCEKDPKTAKQATIDFAQYLRYNLDSPFKKHVCCFTEELEHIQKYLSLEKMRFDDRLAIEWNIQTEDFFVPPLTIQPLVENAVKHGVNKKEDGGTVKISAYEENDYYIVEVADDGIGFEVKDREDDGKIHIGIDNVKKRLKRICNAELTVKSEKNVGTTVTVFLPKEGMEIEDTSSR